MIPLTMPQFNTHSLSNLFAALDHDRLPEVVTAKYSASHAEALAKMQDELALQDAVVAALKARSNSSAGAGKVATGKASGANGPRTLATPDWQGSPPQSLKQKAGFAAAAVQEFQSSQKPPDCMGQLCSNLLFFFSAILV